MADLFTPPLELSDIVGQDIDRLTRLLKAHSSLVLIGPMSTGKSTVLKRWAEFHSATLCPRTSKPDFRKAVDKSPVPYLAIDRLDQIEKGWHDLVVEAMEGGKVVLATFDGGVEAYQDKMDRHLRGKFTPFIFSKLIPEDVFSILVKHDFDPEKAKMVMDCGSIGFAMHVLKAAGTEAQVLELLEAGPGHNDPAAPTVHRGLISDAISCLIKECRRGDVKEVTYWATVLLHHYKASARYLVRRLVIAAGEDHHCIDAYLLAQAVASTYSIIGEIYDQKEYVIRAWALMAALPKWWDSKAGRDYETHFPLESVVLPRDGVKDPPSYALDNHTWSGRRIEAQGGLVDWRASGSPWKRLNMMMLAQGHEPSPELGSFGKAVSTDSKPTTVEEAFPWKYEDLKVMLEKWGTEMLGLRLSADYAWDKRDAEAEEEDNNSGGF